MPKLSKGKEKYPFLKIGYTSFPLRDVGKEFEVIDIVDLYIKKPRFMEFKEANKYTQLCHNSREIEKAAWDEIRKKHKVLFKQADWLVISMISEFGDKVKVSIDLLRQIRNQ